MIYSDTTADAILPRLMYSVLKYGEMIPSRNGATKELHNAQIVLTNPGDGFITDPARKASAAAQIAETAWVLAGRNDVEWLSRYLPRAADFSDDGETWRGGYGPRLRRWYVGETPQVSGAYEVDQLQHVIKLLQEDPNTRRAVMAIYDPAVDTDPGKDIPCNNWLHFLHRDGRLHLTVATRSNDLMWGWSGINAFEWNVLLQVVAHESGLRPGSITFNISSLHLYEPYFPKAQRIVQHNRETALMAGAVKTKPSAPGYFRDRSPGEPTLDELLSRFFTVESLIREKADADTPWVMTELGAAILDFPEPMLRSWLMTLAAWNFGDSLSPALSGTTLADAYAVTPKRKMPEVPVPDAVVTTVPAPSSFLKFVQDLHAEKDAVYGDSWCRRGEQISIMANIARKVDRLGVAGAGDTASDTAIDMAVYLVKYSLWLKGRLPGGKGQVLPTTGPEHVNAVNVMLREIELSATAAAGSPAPDLLVASIKVKYESLERMVTSGSPRSGTVQHLARRSWVLARHLWYKEQDEAAKKIQWAAGNAVRAFNGYALTEEEEAK